MKFLYILIIILVIGCKSKNDKSEEPNELNTSAKTVQKTITPEHIQPLYTELSQQKGLINLEEYEITNDEIKVNEFIYLPLPSRTLIGNDLNEYALLCKENSKKWYLLLRGGISDHYFIYEKRLTNKSKEDLR
ncbi:hypothetical protein LNTAR_13037 [Lentisphaera araneosa HTCC2155]|uniref:Lipoprotein n=1 Tax=Lentisphaera araneosa HTCC2155 TaxID=313628 RepID=A6DRK6_9BACT|nr:hypothetical protein [Lentisphaera araneosa]EDM25675.1 hypothetical protein LNTAR_13037 [Lentisphaera araneosa HTCC2155]